MAKSKKKGPIALASGAVAGGCEICVTMPFDTIKTQMQFHTGPTRLNIYTGGKYIVQQKGIRGLYYGLPAMLTQVSAKASIRFFAFEAAKAKLIKYNGGTEAGWINLLSGLCAGVVESAVWVAPLERLKVLRMAQISNPNPKYRTLVGTAMMVSKEHGIQGLYKGFVPTAMRGGSSLAVRFFLYHDLKRIVTGGKPENCTTIQMLASGFLTGCASTTANMPIDVAKSRIQQQDKANPKYTGTFQCIARTFKDEGFLALYKGMSARILKVGLGQAITFTIYDRISDLLVDTFKKETPKDVV